jgi:hypothetical protein
MHLGVTVIGILFGMSVEIFMTKSKRGINNIKTLFYFSIIIAELVKGHLIISCLSLKPAITHFSRFNSKRNRKSGWEEMASFGHWA